MTRKSEIPKIGSAARSCVLYVRVSSKEQDMEGFSIPSQLKLLRDYAANQGLVITKEFVEVETANTEGRTSFALMLDNFRLLHEQRPILLVEKTDRLYRNLKDVVRLDEYQPEIHLVKEGAIISPDSHSSEKMIHGIKVVLAKHYIDNLSEETRKGMLEKAEQGIWPTHAPMGYKNIIDPNGKKIIDIDPDRAPLVRKLFELYETGKYSVKEATREMRAAGLIYPKSKHPVQGSMVHRMLRTPLYMGDIEWRGRIFPGKHTPIVSRELWLKVQDVLDGRSKRKIRGSKLDFTFSGFIKCGLCGCAVVGEIHKGKYIYYHCTGSRGACLKPYVREEILNEKIVEMLKDLALAPEVLGWVVQALKTSHDEKKEYQAEAVSRLQSEYNRLQARLDAMYIDKLDGAITGAHFDRMAPRWRDEMARIHQDIAAHSNADQDYIDVGVQLLELTSRAHALFGEQVGSEKRRLLLFLLSNCTWDGKELTVEFKQPFDLILDTNRRLQAEPIRIDAETGVYGNWLPGRDLNPRPSD